MWGLGQNKNAKDWTAFVVHPFISQYLQQGGHEWVQTGFKGATDSNCKLDAAEQAGWWVDWLVVATTMSVKWIIFNTEIRDSGVGNFTFEEEQSHDSKTPKLRKGYIFAFILSPFQLKNWKIVIGSLTWRHPASLTVKCMWLMFITAKQKHNGTQTNPVRGMWDIGDKKSNRFIWIMWIYEVCTWECVTEIWVDWGVFFFFT